MDGESSGHYHLSFSRAKAKTVDILFQRYLVLELKVFSEDQNIRPSITNHSEWASCVEVNTRSADWYLDLKVMDLCMLSGYTMQACWTIRQSYCKHKAVWPVLRSRGGTGVSRYLRESVDFYV